MEPQIYVDVVGTQDIKPQENLSAVMAADTQICRGHSPRVSCTSASFKTGRISPDTICRTYSWVDFFLGSPAGTSGQVMLTDSLMSVVTRHVLPPIQSSVFRQPSLLLVDMPSKGVRVITPAPSFLTPCLDLESWTAFSQAV